MRIQKVTLGVRGRAQWARTLTPQPRVLEFGFSTNVTTRHPVHSWNTNYKRDRDRWTMEAETEALQGHLEFKLAKKTQTPGSARNFVSMK